MQFKEIIKTVARPVKKALVSKYRSELNYWNKQYKIENGRFHNHNYEKLMLAIAGETSNGFIKNKIIADFGCGPRGSLSWAKEAQLRIGIDVLADSYSDLFYSNFLVHEMAYVKCTEKVIPLPSASIDIVFTINAMDHVDNFRAMCNEILRILKSDGNGAFMGSFNLYEQSTAAEPQMLTEEQVRNDLLSRLNVISYRTAKKDDGSNPYASMLAGKKNVKKGQKTILWVRASSR